MSSISVAGDTSGSVTLSAPAVSGSSVLTLPVATDTLVGKATTDTLTNKTLGSGTVFPAGSVIQVVNATYSTITTNATTTLADSGLTASITPTKTSSKILIAFSQVASNSVSGSGLSLSLLRGATIINSPAVYSNYGAANIIATVSATYLDSPATISATTYKTQFSRSPANSGTVTIQNDNAVATMTLMEIAG